jgi:hypothetical protein
VLWLTISVLIFLVAGTLLVLVHPVLVTGRYYELTLRTIQHGPQGLVTVTYDETLTYGTWVNWMYDTTRGITANTYGWDQGGRKFPRWPRREQDRTLAFYLTSAEERAKGIADSSEIRQRWVLEPGVYRIRPGDRLVLSRRKWSDGKPFETTIGVVADP